MKKTVTNKRFVAYTLIVLIFFSSCLKEMSVDSFGQKSPTDSTSKDSCFISKLIQGTNQGDDTIRVMVYDAEKKLVKIIDSSDFVGGEDSVLFTYNSSNQLTKVNWVAYGSEIEMSYSGKRKTKMKTTYLYSPDDSTVYTYLYSSGNKPERRKKFIYNDLSGRTDAGDALFNFDAYGDILKFEYAERLGHTFKYVELEYYTDPNPFSQILETSEAWNYFGLAQTAFEELGWSDHAPEYAKFYDENNDLIKIIDFVYENDTEGKITGIRCEINYPNGNVDIYTYRVAYNCK